MNIALHSGTLSTPATPGGASLLVHGGAWDIPDDELDDHRRDLERALLQGKERLRSGASALDVVVEVVALLEASGTFDAGGGSVLALDGRVELDAGCMCGARLRFGSVVGVRHFLQPVKLARALLEKGQGEVRMLAGAGAEAFAQRQGFRAIAAEALVHPREQARYEALLRTHDAASSSAFGPHPSGTVGCVARDAQGRLAAATSTGGTPLKPAGRVGDSPLPGSGFYASSAGAASCTGWGEAIATDVSALRVINGLHASLPEVSARQTLAGLHAQIHNHRGEGAAAGLLVLHPDGSGAWAYTTPRMARAGWSEGQESFVLVG